MTGKYELAILGAGYTGRELARRAQRDGVRWYAVSRRPIPDLVRYTGGLVLRKDLLVDPLDDLPETRTAVITFPLSGNDESEAFIKALLQRARRVIYLNTSGVYGEREGQTVDEDSPVLGGHDRIPGERIVLQNGGTSLRVAGIYGPSRSPMRWVEKGVLRHTVELINLIHRADLCKVILRLCDMRELPPVLNVADGQPRPRSDLFDLYEVLNPEMTHRQHTPGGEMGKAIGIGLLKRLMPDLKLRDNLETIRQEWRPGSGSERT